MEGLFELPPSQISILPKARDCRLISFAVSSSALILQDCRFRFAQTSSQEGSLPKAFQKQTKFAFGFFAPRLFTKASFRHILETKKPITL
jgi:hypothetical protein